MKKKVIAKTKSTSENKKIAQELRLSGYSYSQIAKSMGYKSKNSISLLLDSKSGINNLSKNELIIKVDRLTYYLNSIIKVCDRNTLLFNEAKEYIKPSHPPRTNKIEI